MTLKPRVMILGLLAACTAPPALPDAAAVALAPASVQVDAASPTPPASPPPEPYAPRWTERLGLVSLAAIPTRLGATGGIFGELSRGDKTETPASCNDWARLHALGYRPSNGLEVTPDIAANSVCKSIALLQRARPARKSFVRDLALTPELVALLPLEIAPDLAPADRAAIAASRKAGRSFAQHDPRFKAKPGVIPGTLEITSGDRHAYATLEPLAWGDFDGDGLDDMLVQLVHGATRGSLQTSRLLGLSRADDGPLRAFVID